MKYPKLRIKQNLYGNWYAYAGLRKIKSFGADSFDANWWFNKKSLKILSLVYRQGYDEYYNNQVDLDENPYPVNTDYFESWKEGWRMANEDE